MPLITVIGQAQAQDGREAGSRAAQQALAQLGRMTPALGLVIASFDYPIQRVASGVSEQLGDTPLLGFNTTAEYTSAGLRQHTVAVAVLAGNDIQARADWWPGLGGDGSLRQDGEEGSDSRLAVQRMLQAFSPRPESILLFVADGLTGDAVYLVDQLGAGISHDRPPTGATAPPLQVAGCLTPGDSRLQRSAQIGGIQSGSAGLAAALITGKLALGAGTGHGWFPVGAFFRVTGSDGHWIEGLDEQPAIQAYARLFGQEPQAWVQPPLNDMVRLYPLGLESEGVESPCSKDCPYLVRIPLRFEENGSLRMITPVPQESYAHLLVGSVESCLESTRAAVYQAQSALAQAAGQARPVLALAWVDASFQKLLEAQPGSEFSLVRSILGPDVPILGAYTFGQVACQPPAGLPELLNGHIQILLFGQPAG